MAGRFAKRRAARGALKAESLALRDSLRDWWTARSELRKKAAKAARKNASKVSRGADRVPAHLKGLSSSFEHVVEHTDSPRRDRRRAHLNTGRRMASSTNTPFVSPDRDAKSANAGRLRKELR